VPFKQRFAQRILPLRFSREVLNPGFSDRAERSRASPEVFKPVEATARKSDLTLITCDYVAQVIKELYRRVVLWLDFHGALSSTAQEKEMTNG
jgi:hypothetical protein